MGVKRPFEEFQEPNSKQPKQHVPGSKAAVFLESVDKDLLWLQNFSHEQSKQPIPANELTFFTEPFDLEEFRESSAASSVLAKQLASGSESATFVELADNEKFHRSSSVLNSFPRKQVPVGQDHQADIPLWLPKAVQKGSMGPKALNDGSHLMGSCAMSFPQSVIDSDGCVRIAQGRRYCGCFDEGSIRCIQIHVKEAREKLKEIIGEEKFEQLGFHDMGEGVAHGWTEEEERVFHEVVYSNPASLGKNFWKELSEVFPSRTNMEVVSYYFNAFILRRRAAQNRSVLLEIDSDDDEWYGTARGFHVIEEDEDSEIELVVDQDSEGGCECDSLCDNEDIEVEDGDDSSEVDTQARDEDCMAEYDFPRRVSNPENGKLPSGGPRLGIHNAIVSNNFVEGHYYVQEDLNTSSESQQYTVDQGGSVGVGADPQESSQEDYFAPWLGGESTGSNDNTSGSGFLYETCDASVWDESCSTGFSKGVDILPTCSMIDEFFGPFTPKSDQVN